MKIVLILLTILVVVTPSNTMAFDSEQKSVWALEEAYWAYLKEGDLESWNSQWHDRYVGWPHDATHPIHRDDVIRLNEQVVATLMAGTLEYRLLPQEIVITGDVAIVHYLFNWNAKERTGEKIYRAGKVTHTWYRENDGWRILAGMSAPPVAVVD
jgi:ketosteroid isomerase-like protein